MCCNRYLTSPFELVFFIMNTRELLNKLNSSGVLCKNEFIYLLENLSGAEIDYLFFLAREKRKKIYGLDVYMRGLIEFTNYCTNDCLYCGIRKSNNKADRYRLSEKRILDCCEKGYALCFRTFVLQGGEDPYYNDLRMAGIIKKIKTEFRDCALTLSLGEKKRETYKLYRECGADRYLLRHETADAEHYAKLHENGRSLENRVRCLYDLKELGFQVGCGFMVGSPFQTIECIAEDLLFIRELNPQMVGIGPFIPHHDTPFSCFPKGPLELTLILLAVIRLMLPAALLPATTALGTIDPTGREKGILAGTNVVMPNLSPSDVRGKYLLYDNKICTRDEAAECRMCMKRRIESTGFRLVVSRGDYMDSKK